MKALLLFPVLLYLTLMLVNTELLQTAQQINLFGAQIITVPMFLFSSAFIVIYAMLIYLSYSGIHAYQARKIHKLERQIVDVKWELYNNQKDLLARIQWDFEMQFENFKRDNENKFETIIKFNEYTLEKVLDETHGDFLKYKKETQKLLNQAQWIDKSLLEKLQVWK